MMAMLISFAWLSSICRACFDPISRRCIFCPYVIRRSLTLPPGKVSSSLTIASLGSTTALGIGSPFLGDVLGGDDRRPHGRRDRRVVDPHILDLRTNQVALAAETQFVGVLDRDRNQVRDISRRTIGSLESDRLSSRSLEVVVV